MDEASKRDYGVLFHTFLFTGIRRSEALALRLSDFDPQLNTLSISRSLHQLWNGEYKILPVKTAKGKRIASLAQSTVNVIQEYRQEKAFKRI